MAGDSNPDRVVAGFVEPAADTVLTVSNYMQLALTVFYGCLNLLFQHFGRNPLIIYNTINFVHFMT
jgi:hypothetical protein